MKESMFRTPDRLLGGPGDHVSPTGKHPLRIAIASDWFLPRLGGIELHLADLARQLASLGHSVEILTTTPGDGGQGPYRVSRVPGIRLPVSDLAVSPRLLSRMREALAAGHFDVLHAHVSVVSPTSFAAIVAGHQLGLPMLVTCHSMLLGATRVLSGLDRVVGWTDWPLLLSAVSTHVARQVELAALGREVMVLANGVERSLWQGAAIRRGNTSGEVLVVSAMRLTAKKRPMALIDAFRAAMAAAQASGIRLKLKIAGDGPERARLERAIARRGLSDSVSLLGALPRAGLVDLYRGADMFVLPTVREALGLAALEARCAGLPVVAMQDNGTADFIEHDVTGLLAGSDAELAHCMTRLALDPTMRARLARDDDVLARYDWPAVAAAHVACYEQAIALVRARTEMT